MQTLHPSQTVGVSYSGRSKAKRRRFDHAIAAQRDQLVPVACSEPVAPRSFRMDWPQLAQVRSCEGVVSRKPRVHRSGRDL